MIVIKITIEIHTDTTGEEQDTPPEYPKMIQCIHCGFKRMVNSKSHEGHVKRGKRGHCDGTWIRDLMGGECFSPGEQSGS